MGSVIVKYLADIRLWVLFACLVLVAVLVYSPHFAYRYPLHVDEWHNIYQANKLSQGRYDFSARATFEIGYHAFLAVLSKLGFNLILGYRFLPPLFAVAGAITLFAFVYHLTGEFNPALFSVMFFASLPSNTNLIGLWFAVPLTFTTPLLFLALLLLHKGLEERSHRLLMAFSALILVLLFTYPLCAFLTLTISVIYVASNLGRWRRLSRIWEDIAVWAAILAAATITFMFALGKGLGWFASNLIFPYGWTMFEPTVKTLPVQYELFGIIFYLSPFFLPLLFGGVPFALSIIGLYAGLREQRLNILAIWALICATIVSLFINAGYAPLISYQRAVYYLLLALSPLAGIGLDRLARRLSTARFAPGLLVILLIAATMLLTFHGYGKTDEKLKPYHLVSDADYKASQFLAKEPRGLILADQHESSALVAMTDDEVVAALLFFGDPEALENVKGFFASDCTAKKSVIDKYSVSYVYSKDPIECPGFRRIYSDKRYIYAVK